MRRKNPQVSARLRDSLIETSSRSQKISNGSKRTRSLHLSTTEERSSQSSSMMRLISSFRFDTPQRRIQQLSRQTASDWFRSPQPASRP